MHLLFVHNSSNNFHRGSCTSVKGLHPAQDADNETQGGTFRTSTGAIIFLSFLISAGLFFPTPLAETRLTHPHWRGANVDDAVGWETCQTFKVFVALGFQFLIIK